MKSILPNLSQYKIVLGSNSPRRRELLAGLDIDFEVQTIPDIDESFPKTLRSDEVPVYIARKKAEAYISSMSADELLITADTIVWTFSEILGKPKDREDAIAMLRKLSGHVHEVITGVCITTKEKTVSFSASCGGGKPLPHNRRRGWTPWKGYRLPVPAHCRFPSYGGDFAKAYGVTQHFYTASHRNAIVPPFMHRNQHT